MDISNKVWDGFLLVMGVYFFIAYIGCVQGRGKHSMKSTASNIVEVCMEEYEDFNEAQDCIEDAMNYEL